MQTYAKIEGQIVGQEIMSPADGQNWKPFKAVQVLQKINDKAALVTIKDYNLQTEYSGKFGAVCSISSWAGKTGNSGLNISVVN